MAYGYMFNLSIMKRRLISSILVLGVGFLCASTSLFAQVLQRQSIGFIGGSTNNVEGVFVQSIAAQPYSLPLFQLMITI